MYAYICPICQCNYVPETMTWAKNVVLMEVALGRDPNIIDHSPWFGQSLWRPCDVEEYEVQLTDRCVSCEEKRLEASKRASELCGPQPACGERWDDEY